MNKIKRTFQTAVILTGLLVFCGCLGVEIKQNINNPDRYFARALDRIERLRLDGIDRPSSPRKVCVLIYDGDERELIQVKTPLWLIEMFASGERDDQKCDWGGYEDKWDFDWKDWKNIKDMGAGLLVRIEDEDGQILVWLE